MERNEADMVRDAGLAYRDCDDNGREIYCLVCQLYGGKEVNVPITTYPKLHVTKKAIGRHMITTRHKQALQMQEMEVERIARRTRVGLTVGRATLQTLREGCSYLQIEEKLLTMHLAGLEICSMNHFVRFIKGFVDSM